MHESDALWEENMHLNPIQTVLCITVDGIIGVVTLPFVSSFTDFYIFV